MRTLGAVVLAFLRLGVPAYAQSSPDMNTVLQSLQQQLDALKAQIDQIKAQQLQQQQQAAQQAAQVKTAAAAPQYLRMKPGNTFTFLVGNRDEVTVYGKLDLSFDVAEQLHRHPECGRSVSPPVLPMTTE